VILGHFLKSIAELIHWLIQAYIIIIIIRSVISWMGNVRPNQFIFVLRRLTDPVFRLVHKYMPFSVYAGVDFSPIIIIFILYFLDSFIYSTLMAMALNSVKGGI